MRNADFILRSAYWTCDCFININDFMMKGIEDLPGIFKRVQAFDLKGKPFVLTAEDLLARVIHHELDHLNGRLFIDHLNNKKRERLLKGYQNEVQV